VQRPSKQRAEPTFDREVERTARGVRARFGTFTAGGPAGDLGGDLSAGEKAAAEEREAAGELLR
jgi:hypothetical protein